jgi:hypothetical protein
MFFNSTKDSARELAQGFIKDFPSSMEAMTGRKAQEMKLRAVQSLARAVTEFQQQRRIGIFSRIIFARAFQAELKGAGYSSILVRQLMADVLSHLSFAG